MDAENIDLTAVRHQGSEALRQLFHQRDRLVLVKYIESDCAGCLHLAPIIDSLVEEYSDRLYFVEIDIGVEPNIAKIAQIAGTPTVQFYKNQELLIELQGVKSKTEYRAVITTYA